MLCAVASPKTRENDIVNECDHYEIVRPPFIKRLGAFADDDEGDARSMIGIESRGRATILKVSDTDYSIGQLREVIRRNLHPDLQGQRNISKLIEESVAIMVQIAAKYLYGTILEYRDYRETVRKPSVLTPKGRS